MTKRLNRGPRADRDVGVLPVDLSLMRWANLATIYQSADGGHACWWRAAPLEGPTLLNADVSQLPQSLPAGS